MHHRRAKLHGVILIAFLLELSSAILRADDVPSSGGIPHPLSLHDLGGRLRQLGPDPERAALVAVLLSTECPIANSYLPTLNRLHDRWSSLDNRVVLVGFISDRRVTRQDALRHAEQFEVRFPVIFDGSGELAALLQPTHTPEAFVLDAEGHVAYRGRIDDTYPQLGKRRLQPRSHDVDAAVTALVRGVPVQTAYEKPVGCLFEQGGMPRDAPVTFHRHIAPIIHANCTSCHRAGQVAPFPLETYADVSKRIDQIRTVVETGLMPPWRPHESIGNFVGERRLTEHQRHLLDVWADTGTPEGDAADRQPLPSFENGWTLGTPDLIVRMPEKFEIPADGPDIFQNFVLPLDLGENRFCVAAEFRPGNRRVVHHTIFFLDSTGVARRRDELDPAPGYRTFGGPGFLPTGDVGGWSPGTTAKPLPAGYCRYVAAHSDLVLQVHYHPTGKAESDQSEVGLYFIDRPKNVAASLTVGDFGFELLPGSKDQRITCTYTLTNDVTLLGITPHMHLLGKEMRATARFPDGTDRALIWIDDWHFYWQDQYYLRSPVRLPKGTILEVEARYDNSADNPFNPHSPPVTVRFGEETTDEMCFCFFLVATDSPHDLAPLIWANVRALGLQRMKAAVSEFSSFRN